MKKYFAILTLLFFSIQSFSQKLDITTDIRGSYEYLSDKDSYRAQMEKGFNGSLKFSDNRGNKISYSDKYLKLKNPGLINNKEAERNYFISMIESFRFENDYIASYSADIFDKISFTENKQREHANIGSPTQNTDLIRRNRNGSLEYRNRRENAILERDFFNNWIYKDSRNNEIKLSDQTWKIMMHEFGDDICFFTFLIDNFLTISGHRH